jgi:hypothetical protein
MEKGREQSPEIFACSAATGESRVGRRAASHVQLSSPHRGGEAAVPPASTTIVVPADGRVQGMALEAVAVGDGGEGRLGLGRGLRRFHRLS